jgi:hypothetical protein
MKPFLIFVSSLAIFGGFSVPVANSVPEDRVAIGDLRTVGISAPYGGVGCGGALIAPRIVYTAAHCVARQPKSDRFVNNVKTFVGTFMKRYGDKNRVYFDSFDKFENFEWK